VTNPEKIVTYPAQGQPIPASLGLEGEWILENEFFLAVSDGSSNPNRPIMQRFPLGDGRRCWALDTDLLASMLEISGNELLALNRRGDITVKVMAPIRAGYPATVFVRSPRQSASVALENGPQSGD
jgi:hypothetical protein